MPFFRDVCTPRNVCSSSSCCVLRVCVNLSENIFAILILIISVTGSPDGPLRYDFCSSRHLPSPTHCNGVSGGVTPTPEVSRRLESSLVGRVAPRRESWWIPRQRMPARPLPVGGVPFRLDSKGREGSQPRQPRRAHAVRPPVARAWL
ncbi:hypothetical protein BCV69DRAFT_49428 [Microstroma glucosiphilum]|uniref:Uncharacterized protein n=1 Tax=Pseudomicrostroma glucosiphilum TaxID=1684307 RepID=A0A316U398_9BASI|nr:hypothetical protein BCV69DRAFT_49428 [Pseudomicrostroma glucosiphilum]PWN19274.1 hypothetical protein BCV69DRAFT_49428 [Pseudomicrostroma glucosiphilum]